MSTLEWISLITTSVVFVALVIVAVIGYQRHMLLLLAASVGGVGGLVHEIAQSRGMILFFEKRADGLYLGSIAGAMMGAVAGLLVVRGLLAGHGGEVLNFTDITFDVFMAGLALKGVVEAAGGSPQG